MTQIKLLLKAETEKKRESESFESHLSLCPSLSLSLAAPPTGDRIANSWLAF